MSSSKENEVITVTEVSASDCGDTHSHGDSGHNHFGMALSDTVIEIPPSVARESKPFDWGRLFAGDCTLIGGTLTIFDDGHATWGATVMSSDPGEDSWGARFRFYGNFDVLLWEHGWIWSPTLVPTPILWTSTNQIGFPAYHFPHVAKVTMEYRC